MIGCMTVILGRSDVAALLDADETIAALDAGFRGDQRVAVPGQRVRTELPGPGTAVVLLPGLMADVPAYTVKVNAKFPAGAPALRGAVCLHSLADGELLAIIDSASLTAWRTGLAAALATHVLAGSGAARLGVIGAGAQADLVLRGLARLRNLELVTVTDLDPAAASRFAARHASANGPRVMVAAGPGEVAAAAQLVLLATWSRTALLALADLRPGQQVTSLGPDEPGKCELSDDVLTAATVIVDDVALSRATGALAPAALRNVQPATFGQVLRGEHPGRSDDDEITVYAPVGLPWQDLAVAWAVYQRAAAAGRGTDVDLLR